MAKELNFRQSAIKAVTLAKIMEDREKVDTDELIENYPDGFVIDEIEYVTMQKGDKVDQFWAFHIRGTNTFAFAGFVLAKIFEGWLKEFEGDYEALYEAFNGSDGIVVRLSAGKTQAGRDVTLVEIL